MENQTLGIILIMHQGIGREMIRVVEEIIKEKTPIYLIEMDPFRPLQETKGAIQKAMNHFKDKSGIIILTDLFGATPANLCKEFCSTGKVEMVSGCNLPMILKASTAVFQQGVSEVANFLRTYGCDNIRMYPGK